MSQLLPYRPLASDVVRAVERLETGEAFDPDAFAIANRERWRRIPIMLSSMLLAAGVGALLVWLADRAGWLGWFATPLYAFAPIIFAALLLHPFRADSLKDELRLGRAIGRWEAKERRLRDKVLERRS